MNVKNKSSLKQMALIAMLGALSGVLMLFQVKVPFMPPFYSLDVGDLPALLGGFLMGPASGFMIIIVKLLVKLVQMGSESLLIGELSNFVCSTSFVVPAAILYQRNKTKKGAMLAMVVGSVIMTIVGMLSNAYVMLPMYATAYGLSMDKIIEMCHAVNPAVNSVTGIIFMGTLPFNILKSGIVSLVTFLVYKKASKVLKRMISD